MDGPKNTVAGHIEYRTDLFRRTTVESFVKHFEVPHPDPIDPHHTHSNALASVFRRCPQLNASKSSSGSPSMK